MTESTQRRIDNRRAFVTRLRTFRAFEADTIEERLERLEGPILHLARHFLGPLGPLGRRRREEGERIEERLDRLESAASVLGTWHGRDESIEESLEERIERLERTIELIAILALDSVEPSAEEVAALEAQGIRVRRPE